MSAAYPTYTRVAAARLAAHTQLKTPAAVLAQDAYEDRQPRKKRAEPLKAAQQAYAAVMAAAALTPQPVSRCELCQASFVTEAQLQQHLDGPVHRKAVEKAAKEAARLAHLSQHSAVAQDALAAAAWLGGGSSRSTAGGGHHTRPQQSQQQQQQHPQGDQQGKQQQQHKGRQQGRGPGPGRGPAASREEQLTHEQVLAAAKHDSGPLSIDGGCTLESLLQVSVGSSFLTRAQET